MDLRVLTGPNVIELRTDEESRENKKGDLTGMEGNVLYSSYEKTDQDLFEELHSSWDRNFRWWTKQILKSFQSKG